MNEDWSGWSREVYREETRKIGEIAQGCVADYLEDYKRWTELTSVRKKDLKISWNPTGSHYGALIVRMIKFPDSEERFREFLYVLPYNEETKAEVPQVVILHWDRERRKHRDWERLGAVSLDQFKQKYQEELTVSQDPDGSGVQSIAVYSKSESDSQSGNNPVVEWVKGFMGVRLKTAK